MRIVFLGMLFTEDNFFFHNSERTQSELKLVFLQKKSVSSMSLTMEQGVIKEDKLLNMKGNTCKLKY